MAAYTVESLKLSRIAPQVLAGLVSLTAVGMGWSLSAAEVDHRGPGPALPPGALALGDVEALGQTDPSSASGRETTAREVPPDSVPNGANVAEGLLQGSLFQSAEAAGASPLATAQMVMLLARKLDFSRDLHQGDRFRLVYDRGPDDAGRPIDGGDLLYAEIGDRGRVDRFYRFDAPGVGPQFFDEQGRSIKSLLLRTPVDSARITSGFGMRMHPLLGYTRMHQGVDFGVPVGSPVFAAGDGVVEEAGWKGGYGRWVKLRHAGGWETGYAHLCAWAVHPGQYVRQSEVIGFSGSTGESTGPHLHYEVIRDGRKLNPNSARTPADTVLAGGELAAFELQKARIDGLLAARAPARLTLADASTGAAQLRPAEPFTP